MIIIFLKKIFDVLLYTWNFGFKFLRKLKASICSANKISRSFWKHRNSKNWCLKTRYPELYHSQSDALVDFFNQYFENRKINILDLGCADGSSSIFIVKDFINYAQGFDISPDFISSAIIYAQKHNIKADFFTWDACKEDLKINHSFDVIMALGLFTCIIQDEVFLQIMNRISNLMESGGYLIMKDTLGDHLQSQKISKNYLYAAKYRYLDSYIDTICSKGYEKIEQRKLYQFPNEPYASYFLIFKKK